MNCSHPLDPWIDRSIGEHQRYFIIKRIGGSGMGDVFLATDTLLAQPVALKLLSAKLSDEEMRNRFEREVAICAALRSEHIVQVMDYGVTLEGYPFYVMEYLDGQTLEQALYTEKRLSVKRTIKIVTQICSGLHLAHRGIALWSSDQTSKEHFKVVHRDLKPDNIFLVPTTLGEFVKILDFGIAKICNEQTQYTQSTNVFMGSLHYAAPEQFQLRKTLDERADIYSLGVILYKMLTGTDPFGFNVENQIETPSIMDWAMAHTSKQPLSMRVHPDCEHLSPELDNIVLGCLQKLPEHRPASVKELSQALSTLTGGQVESTTSESAQPRLCWRESSDNRTHIQFFPFYSETHAATQNLISKLQSNPDLSSAPKGLRKLMFTIVGVTTIALAGGVYAIQQLDVPIHWKNLSLAGLRKSTQPSVAAKDPSAQPSKNIVAQSVIRTASAVWAVAFSSDGKILASGGADGTIDLYDFKTRKLLQTLRGHSDSIRGLSFSPKSSILASSSGDKTIKTWDFHTGQLLRTFPEFSGPIWTVAMAPNGKRLVSGSYNGTIKIWNVHTGALIRTLPEHDESIWAVAISPDGRTLASGSYDAVIKIWDLQTGQLRHTLSGHLEAIRAIAISPDGQTLVSGSWDKTIKVWNLKTGTLLRTLSGHTDRVLSVAINSTGTLIASGSIDRTIKVWQLQSGKLLRTLSGHTGWVLSVAFTLRGNTLASGSKDQTVKLWQLNN
jgi:eukaryotic-like serine/threonine-protein kinase